MLLTPIADPDWLSRTDAQPDSLPVPFYMNMMRLSISIFLLIASSLCNAEVPTYDFRKPQRDGVTLVGMECHHRNLTLEIGLFFPASPPAKRMDLWNLGDLAKFNRAPIIWKKPKALNDDATWAAVTTRFGLKASRAPATQCGCAAPPLACMPPYGETTNWSLTKTSTDAIGTITSGKYFSKMGLMRRKSIEIVCDPQAPLAFILE